MSSVVAAQTGPSWMAQLTAEVSPLYRISAVQIKSAITVEAKTFNNHMGFERGLWQHQTRSFAGVPKRRVI
jgi:hypothetical protein